jgi:hypothetical protein
MLTLTLTLVATQLHEVPAERAAPRAAPPVQSVAVAVEPAAAATQDEPIDEAPRRRLWGLSIVGGAVGMTAYIAGAVEVWRASVVIAASSLPPRSGWLMLPLVGPWMALTDPSTASSGTTGLAIVAGVTQLLGLGLTIFGPLITIDGAAVNLAPTGVSGTF